MYIKGLGFIQSIIINWLTGHIQRLSHIQLSGYIQCVIIIRVSLVGMWKDWAEAEEHATRWEVLDNNSEHYTWIEQ